jgi:hypothetical protein
MMKMIPHHTKKYATMGGEKVSLYGYEMRGDESHGLLTGWIIVDYHEERNAYNKYLKH